MRKIARTAHPRLPSSMPGRSKRVNESVVCPLVNVRYSTAKPIDTTSRPRILVRLLSPRLRALRDLDPVVQEADDARADHREHHEEAGAGEDHATPQVGDAIADARGDDDRHAAHRGSARLRLVPDALAGSAGTRARALSQPMQELGAEERHRRGDRGRDEERDHVRPPPGSERAPRGRRRDRRTARRTSPIV